MILNIKKMIQGYLAVIASAVLYGCMPLMAKYIYADGVNPMTLVFLRNFLALPVIALMAYSQNRTLKIPLKLLPNVAVTSLFGGCITPLLLFTSYQFIASGTASIFHFIYPAVVVVAGFFMKKDTPSWSNLLSVLLCFGGICLFYEPGASLDWRGSLAAIASGFTYAAYILLLSRGNARKLPSFLYSFYLAVSCSVAMLLVCLVTGQLALPQSLTGWGLCFLFAIGITCGAVVLFQLGTFLIGGQQSSILSALEPITGVVIGAIVFHEALGVRSVLGSVLVVLSTILIGVYNFRKAKKPASK